MIPIQNEIHGFLPELKEADEISNSPSRTSENEHLLHKRISASEKISNIQKYICIAFILLLVILSSIIFCGMYYVVSDCSSKTLGHNFWDQEVKEDIEKLNAISRQLSFEIKADNIRRNMDTLAKSAHIAGTREQSHIMHYLAQQYANLGLSVKVYNYTVLLNYPQISVPNIVEVRDGDGEWATMSFGRGTPLGAEMAINEQQDVRSQQWWNAYSANGTAEGQIVFCNYGTKTDYDHLAQLGVVVRGRIALIRYGGIKRSEKVRLAQNHGMTAVIFFSDPTHYTTINQTNVFPESVYLPGDDAQRGSVLASPGDPLTPLLPSLIYTHREETEASARVKGVLPSIPVTPIGYNDAKRIMDLMDGDPVPNFEWRGGLNSVYRVTGEKHFRVTVNSRFLHRTISNVIATLRGSEEPDKWIIVGNHVDAWGNGAVDPISGTSTQLEMARAITKIFKEVAPKRTIVFCHWDAEEYGLIGSTEWVEEMQHVLHRRAVAYINVDHVAGTVTPDVKSVPLLYRAIVSAAKRTKQLNTLERTLGRTKLFDSWRHYRGKGPILGDRGVPDIGLPTSGSDYQRFISFLGIPAADLKMENRPGTSYPLYHTMYETPWMVNTLMDPSFESFVTVGNFWMELVHRLANSLIIPFDVVDYGTVISSLVQRTESHLNHLNLTRSIPTINDQLVLLKDALKRLQIVAHDFHQIVNDIQIGLKTSTRSEIEVLNNRLQEIERCFIDWTQGNQLNRHLIFAQSQHSPHINYLSQIQDSAKEFSRFGRASDSQKLSLAFSKLHLAIESVIKVLTL
ncbi:unnamed protein product [Caenorhabditis bovis]|uniref:Uncharacterized protein n=1 Tax=Caenorhabditis bovis TaxID=2654633 RepID=A0A8S1FBF9_9PELO|nr:unnamed protein product [Caenorhabditis bovis]